MSDPKREFFARLIVATALCAMLLPIEVTIAAAPPSDKSLPRTNISVTASAANKSSDNSSLIIFTITIANGGPRDAKGVLLEAVADAGVLAHLEERLVQTSDGIRCHAEILVCEVGDLAANASVEIRLVSKFAASLPATVGLEFRITSETVDTVPFDNRYYSSTFLPGS